MIDGKICVCEPIGFGFEVRDSDCPLDDDEHKRQRDLEYARWKS